MMEASEPGVGTRGLERGSSRRSCCGVPASASRRGGVGGGVGASASFAASRLAAPMPLTLFGDGTADQRSPAAPEGEGGGGGMKASGGGGPEGGGRDPSGGDGAAELSERGG